MIINRLPLLVLSDILFLILSLLKNKFLAIQLGVNGLGLLSLLIAFFSIIESISSSWIIAPLSRNISNLKTQGKDTDCNELINKSFWLLSSTIAISSLMLFSLQKAICEFIFKIDIDKEHYHYFIVFFILNSFSNLFICYLNGLNLLEKNAIIKTIIPLITLPFYFYLTKFSNISGALQSMTLGAFLSCLFAFYFMQNNLQIRRIHLKNLLNQITSQENRISFILTIINVSSDFIKKNLINLKLNSFENGIYQSSLNIIRMSSLFANQIYNISIHKFNEVDGEDLNNYFNRFFYQILTSTSLILFMILLFSKKIIQILYTSEFEPIYAQLEFFSIPHLILALDILLINLLLKTCNWLNHFHSQLCYYLIIITPLFFLDQKQLLFKIALIESIASIVLFISLYYIIKQKFILKIDFHNLFLFCFSISVVLAHHFFLPLFYFSFFIYILISIKNYKYYE